MRKYYFSLKNNLHRLAFASLLFTLSQLNAQVGIGTTSPQAMLDVVASDPNDPSSTDGFLMPRVNALSFDSNPPAVGTMVFYNGALTGNMKHTVYYYADDSNWRNLSGEIANSSVEPELFDYDEDNGGVIFWIDPNDAYHYRIVAPLEFNIDYGSNSTSPAEGGQCTRHQCTFGVNGLEATKSWIDAHSSLTEANYGNYAPSMAYYFDGGSTPGTTHNGWYLPGVGEMRVIGKNRDAINLAFPPSHDDIGSDTTYWVSQDSKVDDWDNGDNPAQAATVLVNPGDNEDHLKIGDEKKNENNSIRIVKEIGG